MVYYKERNKNSTMIILNRQYLVLKYTDSKLGKAKSNLHCNIATLLGDLIVSFNTNIIKVRLR